jgi:hypothetical protein
VRSCVSSTSAPISVVASSGSAGAYFGASVRSVAMNSSAMRSCTSTREGALQDSPWLKNMPPDTVLAARATSA